MAASKSKFAGVLHKLPKLASAETPAYQERVEAEKMRIRSEMAEAAEGEPRPIAFAKRYAAMRAEQARITKELSDANLTLEALNQLLIDTQENGETGWGEYGASPNMLRLVTGDTLRVQPEPYSVTEDKDALRASVIGTDLERLLTLPWQTINSHNKERLLNGEPEMPGTKLYLKTKVVFVPLKKDKIADVDEIASF